VRLFSYKIARDYGFAPNPFHGYCTLATCKPQIRKYANIGDLIIGCGSNAGGNAECVIFAMLVSEKLSYSKYWSAATFKKKIPIFSGSRAQAYGDNIYHLDAKDQWIQANSHHSLADGKPNQLNIDRDTHADSVLIAENFVYWGGAAEKIPQHLRSVDGDDVYPLGRAYRSRFSNLVIQEALEWFNSIKPRGYLAKPTSWN
jgi:hypothetical protein